jgi:hypothetical protein
MRGGSARSIPPARAAQRRSGPTRPNSPSCARGGVDHEAAPGLIAGQEPLSIVVTARQPAVALDSEEPHALRLDNESSIREADEVWVRPPSMYRVVRLTTRDDRQNGPKPGSGFTDYQQAGLRQAAARSVPRRGSRTATYQLISRTTNAQVNKMIKFFGGPYPAESEPHSRSSGGDGDRAGRPGAPNRVHPIYVTGVWRKIHGRSVPRCQMMPPLTWMTWPLTQ